MVPWIKRRHAPQFCDEIPNFQCCMTSFSHLVADLLNVRYIPQFWDEMTKFQCCKTSLPHIGAHIHTLFWKQCNVSRWLKLVVWVTDLNCIFTTMVEVACMDHLQLHPNNLVFAIVPKRGHAPQFCDEILNFQCCMTSFSHLVAENWLYRSQTWIASLLIGLTVVLFLVGNSDSWSHICDLNNLVFTIVSWIKRRHMPTSSILSHKLQHG